MPRPILVVGGPTASGKSALAIKLAKDLAGEVIVCDSVQVYRGLDVGSAKITSTEAQEVRHHLLDICEPNQIFHAGEFVNAARNAITDIQSRDKLPIVCAGTGLYLTSLLHGLADAPPRDPELRAKLELESNDNLQKKLFEMDPQSAARLHMNDRIRVIRAIESSLARSRPFSETLGQHRYAQVDYSTVILCLCQRREGLYRSIDQRAASMVENDLVGETKLVVDRFGFELPPLSTIGYHESCQYLRGQLKLNELAGSIAQATRRLAKRQMTYWRNEPKKRGWLLRPGVEDPTIVLEATQARKRLPPVKGAIALDLSYPTLLSQLEDRFKSLSGHIELWYVHRDRLCAIEGAH